MGIFINLGFYLISPLLIIVITIFTYFMVFFLETIEDKTYLARHSWVDKIIRHPLAVVVEYIVK